MNPNLNRNESYLRIGKKMYTPIHPELTPEGDAHPNAGKRTLDGEYESINSAKRRSRELMKTGRNIVTKE